ncbi:MAG: porin [Rickettsiales bacterium]|nr:porin [Rickettsiales bacterium]
MKKLLLATSALVGLASSAALAGGGHAPVTGSATSANAGALNVMVGGFVNVEHAIGDQDNAANSQGITSPGTAGQLRDASFTNDAEIHVTVAGSAEDFDYGGVVELNAQIDNTDAEGGLNADRVFIFGENDSFGRVEFGGNAGASQSLEIDASNIARGTGGIEGTWWNYVDIDSDNNAVNYIIQPNLVIAEQDQRGSDVSKITYYTPRFSGVQLGVSYTNDSGDLGSANTLSGTQNAGQYDEVFSGGINFEQNFDGVDLALAAVGETGQAETSTVNDLSAYSFGGKLGAEGFSVAGNWADLGDSGLATTATEDSQTYWTAGAAYENGPYGVSVTHLNSEQGQGTVSNELANTVVGADYQLAPGLTPYVEAAFFELDAGSTARADNDGNVVVLGAELSF